MQKTDLPLTKEYQVEFDKIADKRNKKRRAGSKTDAAGKRRLPCFSTHIYLQGFETKATDKDTITIPDGDKILIVHRNKEAEQRFIDKLSSLAFTVYPAAGRQ